MSRRPFARGAVAIALVGVIGACGAPAARPARSPEPVRVEVRLFAFHPGQLLIAPGTTVTWVNEDDIAHTVTSGRPGDDLGATGDAADPPEPDGVFDGELEGPGATFSFTFQRPGTYTYYCDIHRGMHGTVVVR